MESGSSFKRGGAAGAVPAQCDVLVVGGGINGAGIARDLAGRGLSVVLVEKDDLASHTSSSSTKLIHGGLRYLEYYEFSLVRKALAEREVLLRAAPHIMWPLRFVMPHDAGLRPVWMIRAGLFLYDHLARREVLPGSDTVDLRRHPAGAPLKRQYTRGFVYSDGWVDDARLVVLNAMDAARHGATILTRTMCTEARREGGLWRAVLRGPDGQHALTARAVVNAAGPWAASFLGEHTNVPQTRQLRLVKGSHLVVKKLFDHDHAYIFQNPDKRIIFAIPYEGEFTLIGTTDVELKGSLGDVGINADETAYLCAQASRYFERAVTPADVVWSYAGVRPLLDDASGDPSAVTRDYLLDLDTAGAPLLTVWGGKITTFRKLAEEATELLKGPLGVSRGEWTAAAALPGGDLRAWIGAPVRPDTDFEKLVAVFDRRWPSVAPAVRRRWARQYGAESGQMLRDAGLGDVQDRTDISPAEMAKALGREVAPGLFEAELRYLAQHEWARQADDVLWRRTKLGLHYTPAQRQAVAVWWSAHLAPSGIEADVDAAVASTSARAATPASASNSR